MSSTPVLLGLLGAVLARSGPPDSCAWQVAPLPLQPSLRDKPSLPAQAAAQYPEPPPHIHSALTTIPLGAAQWRDNKTGHVKYDQRPDDFRWATGWTSPCARQRRLFPQPLG